MKIFKMGAGYGAEGVPEKPTILYEISTNDNTLLDGSQLTVNGTAYDLTGSTDIVQIPSVQGTTYNATLSDKDGYIKPTIPTFVGDDTILLKRLAGQYKFDKAYIDVNVTSEDGAIPTGVTVSVGDLQKTFEGTNPLRFEVKTSTQYTVSLGEWVGGNPNEPKTVMSGGLESVTKVDMSYNQMPVVGNPLNTYSWADIKKISDKQLWDKYNFKVGDTKEVEINGTVSENSFSGKYYCFILGFNHNSALEGTGISFGFGKSGIGGSDVVYMSYQMTTGKNHGGWEKSLMRTETCTQFLAALPADLQAVIKEITKYTDNGSTNKTLLEAITATKDKVFIMSAFEMTGQLNLSGNFYENTKQKQYEYYISGNSKYRGNYYFCRSRNASDKNGYQFFGIDNRTGALSATIPGYNKEWGFAPCFVI